jgi:tetratricopeptide (TPR) repeat protein
VKKISLIFFLFLWSWSCVTLQPPPPSIYIENLPQSITSGLTLEERIAAEEAWKNLKQGNASKAEKTITRLGVDSPIYYVGLGYVYFVLDDLPTAEEGFKAAIRNSPDLTLAHLGLAQLYQKTGQEDRVFSELQEVLKREPSHPWAKQEFATLKTKKTGDFLDQAKAFQAEGNIEKSKEAYLKALHYSPECTEAHMALAKIYKKANDPKSALVHLKAANTNEPSNKKILTEYAEALFAAEQYPKSLDIYENLQDLEPQNKEIQERIESIKNKLGIFELASQYNTIPAAVAISREEIAALLAVKFKGILEDPTAKNPIVTDIATSWASKYILKITALGILDVYANHTFEPKKIVTRAEMAEILLRLVDFLKKKGYKLIQQFSPERIQISDIAPDNYYYPMIAQIIAYQIMDLSPQKAFSPEQSLSGQEAIKILDIVLALVK